jgi:hypothetical protein
MQNSTLQAGKRVWILLGLSHVKEVTGSNKEELQTKDIQDLGRLVYKIPNVDTWLDETNDQIMAKLILYGPTQRQQFEELLKMPL